jgi:hypothetical protein
MLRSQHNLAIPYLAKYYYKIIGGSKQQTMECKEKGITMGIPSPYLPFIQHKVPLFFQTRKRNSSSFIHQHSFKIIIFCGKRKSEVQHYGMSTMSQSAY